MSCILKALQNREECKNRRQKIIITCEPEDVKVVEEALERLDYGKCQGTIQITYEPSMALKEG